MPVRKNKFIGGQYYHVYNRGVNKGLVFHSEDNYRYCIQLLKKGLVDTKIGVIAFCLMPNHYHLLIRQEGTVPADRWLGVVFNAFVQALNKQVGRTGALFEGRFKSILIDRNEHLMHLCRYIHLNPVKAGLVEKAADWKYSNYLEWLGVRRDGLFDASVRDDYFKMPSAYADFVSDGMSRIADTKMIERYLIGDD